MMGDELRILTLGVVQITLNGKPIEGFVSRKVTALMIYLAVTGRPHGREVLAELLWDDLPPDRKASYLRTVLSSLQKKLFPYLIVTRSTLSINPEANIWLDFHVLEKSVADALEYLSVHGGLTGRWANDLAETVQLYKGTFLEGFYLRNADGFEDWLIIERERLDARVADAYYHLLDFHLKQHNFEFGIEVAQKAVLHAPFHEGIRRLHMRLLAGSGQRAKAVAQYQAFVDRLQMDMGIEPEEETTTLFEVLQQDNLHLIEQRTPQTTNLPVPATPFLGREADIGLIKSLLQAESQRLVTLVGIGGIGKTRLAIEVARQLTEDFVHGVFFVACTHVRSLDQLTNQILSEVGAPHSQGMNTTEAIRNYLWKKHLLLVLDNFEHLQAEAELLSQLINGTEQLVLLVTSRERLNLHGETLFIVDALPLPDSKENAPSNAAVKLFVQSAKRVNPEFEDAGDGLSDVIQLTHLVGGMPLALELAASWADILTVAEINAEVKQGLDILETQLQDVPERQRSVRAAFDATWKRLDDRERRAFVEMSIFENSFDREAAQSITGATLRILQMLVNRSLIVPHNRRFYMHPLIQQYGRTHIVLNTSVTMLLQKHSTYYMRMVTALEHDIKGRRQVEAIARIEADIDNIRSAWEYATLTRSYALIDEALEPLYVYFYISTRINDGYLWLKYLSDTLGTDQEHEYLWMRLVSRYALIQRFAMDDPELMEKLEKALKLARKLEKPFEEALCLEALAVCTFQLFDQRQDARRLFENSRRIQEQFGDTFHITRTYHKSGVIHTLLGEFDRFVELTETALHYARESGNLYGTAYALNNLADAAFSLGDPASGLAHLHDAITIMRQLGKHTDALYIMGSLAELKLFLGELEAAEEINREIIQMETRLIFSLDNIVWSIPAACAILRGDLDRAEQTLQGKPETVHSMNASILDFIAVGMLHCERRHIDGIREFIQAAVSYRCHPRAIGYFCVLLPLVSVLLLYEGDEIRAVRSLSAAYNHPKSITGWLKRWSLLDTVSVQLKESLGQEAFDAAWQEGMLIDPIALFRELALYEILDNVTDRK